MALAITVLIQPWRTGDQLARLALEGTLDTATAPQLEHELDEVFAGPTRVLVFDLGGLSFLTSGGVRVILTARKRVLERAGTFIMLRVQPRIEKTFAIIKALEGVQLFEDDAALDAFLSKLQTPPVGQV
jgi:anti-sigma B factor antagonist